MNIEWIGGHAFVPDIGEVKMGDKKTVSDELGRRLVSNDLAIEIVDAQPTKKAKEIEK